MNRSQEVLSHWHKVYENFATSSLDFYAMVEQEIGRWKIPDVRFSRVEWKESGVLSSNRIYLRVTRGPLNFDICAAPYGTGYFFSWWVAATSKRLLAWVYFVMALFVVTFVPAFMWTFTASPTGGALGMAGVWVILLLFALLARAGWLVNEDAVIAMPLFGRLYTALLRPITYFEIDTAHMFQEAVGAAVLEVIETVTTARGIRELTELERRPIAFEPKRRARAAKRFA